MDVGSETVYSDRIVMGYLRLETLGVISAVNVFDNFKVHHSRKEKAQK